MTELRVPIYPESKPRYEESSPVSPEVLALKDALAEVRGECAVLNTARIELRGKLDEEKVTSSCLRQDVYSLKNQLEEKRKYYAELQANLVSEKKNSEVLCRVISKLKDELEQEQHRCSEYDRVLLMQSGILGIERAYGDKKAEEVSTLKSSLEEALDAKTAALLELEECRKEAKNQAVFACNANLENGRARYAKTRMVYETSKLTASNTRLKKKCNRILQKLTALRLGLSSK